jgi:predicted nucleotidyltransferase
LVSAYESGRREPSFEALVNLIGAAGFEVTLSPTPATATSVRFAGPVGRRLQRRRSRARQLLESRGYRNPTVFGSVARNTDSPASDVDLLVDLPEGVGLYELNRMAIDLEALIGAPVDLIPRDALRPRVADDAGADPVPL